MMKKFVILVCIFVFLSGLALAATPKKGATPAGGTEERGFGEQ